MILKTAKIFTDRQTDLTLPIFQFLTIIFGINRTLKLSG